MCPTCHINSVVDGSAPEAKHRYGKSGSFYHLPTVLTGVQNFGGVGYFPQSSPASDQVVLGYLFTERKWGKVVDVLTFLLLVR